MNKALTIILLILAIFLTGCGQRPKTAETGKPAPDFTLTDTNGKTWELAKLKGQVVFVNFWATWCPPCRQEMPSMQRLFISLPNNKFKMLAILSNDDPALAEKLTKKLGVTFPILLDPDNKAAKAYGLTGVPETFIVDKNGILRNKYLGAVQWDSPQVSQMLMQYLTE